MNLYILDDYYVIVNLIKYENKLVESIRHYR